MTLTPLTDPNGLFASIDGVANWSTDQSGGYVLLVDDVRVAAPAVTRALVAAGADVLSLVEVRHSLEEVYLELVGDVGKGGHQ
jgi:ABC-2 type transport system ATP-binding protein